MLIFGSIRFVFKSGNKMIHRVTICLNSVLLLNNTHVRCSEIRLAHLHHHRHHHVQLGIFDRQNACLYSKFRHVLAGVLMTIHSLYNYLK